MIEDPIMLKHYPRGVPIPKKVDRDAEMAAYADPWAPEWLSRHDDLQKGVDSSTLDTLDIGHLPVAGFGCCPALIGYLVLGVNQYGQTTVSLASV